MTAAARLLPALARDADSRRWTLCALVALAAHLVAGAALLAWNVAPIEAALPPPAIMIDLAPSEPAPAAAPAETVPEPPPPEPPLVSEVIPDPQPPAISEPPPPAPDPLPELKPAAQAEVTLPPPPPKPRVPPLVRHRPEAPKPMPQPPPVATAPAEPAAPAAPAPAKAAEPAPPSVATAAVSEDVLAKFLRSVSIHLERLKRYPREAMIRHEQGTVLLRFLLTRDGSVLSAQVERSSGHETLDREVLALIKRAEPLPAFPPELPQQQLQLVLPVPFLLH